MELDYTDLIEYILESLDLNYTRRDGYYLTQSPYGQDNVSSFQIFLDGFAVSYNQDIDGESRIPIKKICVDLGFLQDYISFIVDKNNIPIYKLNQYRELIIKKNLKEIYNYKKYRKLRDLFNEFYISQADVLGVNELNNIQKIRKAKSRKKKRTRIIEVTQTEEEYQQCLEYITGRKIQFEDGRIESVTLMINSWRVNAIAFRHTNGHVKYRLLNDDFRYISTGRYEVPFIVKNENNKKVIVGEGQIEMESIRNIQDYDIFAMANTNSLGDLTILENYDECVILIDNDTIHKVETGIRKKITEMYPNIKLKIVSKFDSKDKSLDFNKFLIDNDEKELLDYLQKRLDINK